MAFYGLPLPHTLVEHAAGIPTSLPEGVKFELLTLPVRQIIILLVTTNNSLEAGFDVMNHFDETRLMQKQLLMGTR